MNVALNEIESKELLKASLVDGESAIATLSKNDGRFHLFSVWKPAGEIHLADVLVARVISAIAVAFPKSSCRVYFSNYMPGKDLQKDEEAHAASRFYYSFFSELFHLFCRGDRIEFRRVFPAETQPDLNIKIAYDNFKSVELPKFSPESKIRQKEWPSDELYAPSLISIVAREDPEYLICGAKHDWIWEPFVFAVLRKAELKTPKALFIKDIEGLTTSVMDAKDDDCLFVDSQPSELIQKLTNVPTMRTNPCILKLLEWFCFPSGLSFSIGVRSINDIQQWKEADGKEEDLCSAATHVFRESLREVRSYVSQHKLLLSAPRPFVVTNTSIIDKVEETLKFGSDSFFSDKGDPAIRVKGREPLDSRPDRYRDAYISAGVKVIESVGGQSKLVSKLSEIFRSCERIDQLQSVFNRSHRDHFSHQFNVYGLGLIFLSAVVVGRKTLKEVIAESVDDKVEEVDFAWAVSALLHDHAYPLEYLYQVKQRIIQSGAGLSYERQIDELYEALMCALPDAYVPGLVPRGEDAIQRANEEMHRAHLRLKEARPGLARPNDLRHGYLAVANILKKIDSVGSAELSPLMKAALSAIATHDIEATVTYSRDPLSCLLIICDELHEWGRPVLRSGHHACPVCSMLINLSPRDDGGLDMPEKLEVEFQCSQADTLKQVGWRENIFSKGKSKAFRRIQFSVKDMRPHEISAFVRVPCVVQTRASRNDSE